MENETRDPASLEKLRHDSRLFVVLERFADVCAHILPGAVLMFALLAALGALK